MIELEVERKSMFTGVIRKKTFMVFPEDVKRYAEGAMIQNAFPYLSADDREFIMTGITPEEWSDQ